MSSVEVESSSFFFKYLSKKNIPKGINEETNAKNENFLLHLYSVAATYKKYINKKKRRPCVIPTILTGIGFPARYFIGIAIKRRVKYDKPSTKLANLNFFIDESNKLISNIFENYTSNL